MKVSDWQILANLDLIPLDDEFCSLPEKMKWNEMVKRIH